LTQLGFKTDSTSRVGEELWYHSPFRDEKPTPSVSANDGTIEKDVFQIERVMDSIDKNTSLHRYIIAEKCIDAKMLCNFLKPFFSKTRPQGNLYTAVGIENRGGGYEIRNPFFKGTVPESGKSFSWFQTASGHERTCLF
jgi:hypothetical protein